jgi:predicted DNA-binding transcriptional regulator YafY
MRASRLLSILLLLQNRGRLTAPELAEATGASVRTIYRDIDALAAAGIPVYGAPGPGGGYALVDGFRTRLTGLTREEASALFLAGIPGPAAELGLGALLAAAELKLLASLPPTLQASAALVRARFLLDAPGWFREEDRPRHLAAVASAVWEERSLQMRYRERERTVEPLGLVLKGGAWYLVARSDGEARTYRVSRIEALEALGGTFARPDDFDLADYWREAADAFFGRLYSGEAVVRLSPRGMARLPHLDDPWVTRATLASAEAPDSDGWSRVVIPIESEEIAVDQLLRLGPEAEVLAPESLRQRVADAVSAMARLYGNS